MSRNLISLELKPYVALPTLAKFHECNDFFRCIRGPIGSGKSVGCVMEIFMRAIRQQAWKGVRRSRWAIVRNTHSQLVSTSMATFSNRLPERVNGEPFAPIVQEMRGAYRARIQRPLSDGTFLDLDVMFIALDRPEDANKIKSLDLTGIWLNELSEIDQEILRMSIGRVGRFPSTDEGGATFKGIVADTNPPDETHYLARMEMERPSIEFEGKVYKYNFFVQPPALIRMSGSSIGQAAGGTSRGNPDPQFPVTTTTRYVPNRGQVPNIPAAENIPNLPDGYGYYISMLPGASEEWINVYILGNFGSVMEGKRVFHEFNDALHRAKEPIQPVRGLGISLGIDWGFSNAACVFVQLTPRGQLLVLDEVYSERSGIKSFIEEMIRPLLKSKYDGMHFMAYGDPAGGAHSNVDGQSCIQAANDLGIPTEAAPSNDPLARQEAVRNFLTRLVDGQPGILISPTCKKLLSGFNGGYHYKKAPGSSVRVLERVDKNEYSHVHDALQYVAMSIGSTTSKYDPFNLGRPAEVNSVRQSAYYWG